MAERINTVVIGGGQAGLAISYYLTQQGREHVVLEKDRVGESWRSKKWDSFTLVTPNRQMLLPGHRYEGDDPDGFMARDEVVRYLDDYVALFNPPLRLGVEVTAVEANVRDAGYTVETDGGDLDAENVVVATGTFQRPKLPVSSQALAPHIAQRHTSLYRDFEHLRPGAVLVVGSGQSGCQIAEELYQSGRRVYLCTGSAGRVPRTYRGKDFTWWLTQMGFVDRPVDELDSPAERFDANPHVTGKDGGHTLNLHQFARDGVTLLGRFEAVRGSKVKIKDNLMDNLKMADGTAKQMKGGIDKFIQKAGIDAPEAEEADFRDGYDTEINTDLDLDDANIQTVIWTISCDYD